MRAILIAATAFYLNKPKQKPKTQFTVHNPSLLIAMRIILIAASVLNVKGSLMLRVLIAARFNLVVVSAHGFH